MTVLTREQYCYIALCEFLASGGRSHVTSWRLPFAVGAVGLITGHDDLFMPWFVVLDRME